MKLRFNLGAIIELSMLPSPGTQRVTGKVISVTADEVEVCPQFRVYRYVSGNDQLDTTVSADAKFSVHIRRSLISYWKYATVFDLQDTGFTVKERSSLLSFLSNVSIDDCTLNEYDSTGFCKGTGKYCGDIEEEDSTIIIISDSKGSNDCNQMSLNP